jgi:hypothetical protein
MKLIVPIRLLGPAFAVALVSATSPANAGAPGAAAAPPPVAKATEAIAPKRTKLTCAQFRANAEAHAKNGVFNTRLKAGGWGNIPPALRKLPPGAKLCGADGMGQAVITSPLFGKEIETYYSPLFAKVGFEPLACKVVAGRTQCTCKRHRDIGIVVTDQESEAFVLAVMKRS